MGVGQMPRIAVPSLMPPSPKTEYSHPRCYLKCTADCSRQMSREHYISENILRNFTRLRVSGMPWQEMGDEKFLPASSLVANILCSRHNNALSPLDRLAGHTFDSLVAAADYAVNQRHEGRIAHHLVSGHALELWMYKLMAGIYFGGIAAANGSRVRDTCCFPDTEIAGYLTEGTLAPNGGMYVTQNVGLIPRSDIGVAPLIDAETDTCVGVQVQFGPLRFETTVIHPNLPTNHQAIMAQRRRPHAIDYSGPSRDARIVLTWPRTKGAFNRLGLQVRP